VRSFDSNGAGASYGSTYSFTARPETVTDIDGNVYNTVTIGTQVWMVENLKVTRYRNGDPIPEVSDSDRWFGLLTGACCNYKNDTNIAAIYGKLYNWYAVNDSRNICPRGWHVPTRDEWTELARYIGGKENRNEYMAGGKLKEAGTIHWQWPNKGATNESGFTALPGGCRGMIGPSRYGNSILSMGNFGHWWSSTEYFTGNAFFVNLGYAETNIARDLTHEHNGLSVRCIKDN